jgi:hypothetical protein
VGLKFSPTLLLEKDLDQRKSLSFSTDLELYFILILSNENLSFSTFCSDQRQDQRRGTAAKLDQDKEESSKTSSDRERLQHRSSGLTGCRGVHEAIPLASVVSSGEARQPVTPCILICSLDLGDIVVSSGAAFCHISGCKSALLFSMVLDIYCLGLDCKIQCVLALIVKFSVSWP